MKTYTIEKHKIDRGKILGQFFTREAIVEKLLDILLEFKKYSRDIKILEPSFGTGSFINVLQRRKFSNIDGCEIDSNLTNEPKDFFDYSLDEKYDLIIGNPPFSKYNIRESYCYIADYLDNPCHLNGYLPNQLLKRDKERIENLFILKSIKHLKNKNSSIAFILPISFFIKNKNKLIKSEILNNFSTVIIFQNREVWFDYNIPCCFAIFTNILKFKNKIIIYYENKHSHREIVNINEINEELIPEVFYNKKFKILSHHHAGILLKAYLNPTKIKYKKSFQENNVSAKNILEKSKIPSKANIKEYKLATVRVGNSSVGKAGLINIRKDILNDMFYVFDFSEKYANKKRIKEKICAGINKNQDYFKSITCRVGSKSIKKEDVFNFRITV